MPTINLETLNDENIIQSEHEMIRPIDEEMSEEEKKSVANRREKNSLLAIAYYNAGSQLEFMKNYKECAESFVHAIEILKRNFAPNYPLTIEFKKTLSKVIGKYAGKAKFNQQVWARDHNNLSRKTCSIQRHRTQHLAGKIPRPRSKSRPFTAKSRHTVARSKLVDLRHFPL